MFLLKVAETTGRDLPAFFHPSTSSEPVSENDYGVQESILPTYVAWRDGTTNRVVVPARQAGNLFLGSLQRSTNTGSVNILVPPALLWNKLQ